MSEPTPDGLTEFGLAEIIAANIRGRYCYVSDAEKWAEFRRGIWVFVKGELAPIIREKAAAERWGSYSDFRLALVRDAMRLVAASRQFAGKSRDLAKTVQLPVKIIGAPEPATSHAGREYAHVAAEIDSAQISVIAFTAESRRKLLALRPGADALVTGTGRLSASWKTTSIEAEEIISKDVKQPRLRLVK